MENILEVRIEKIVPNGFGLARYKHLTIFVALAAVGDRLRVRLDRKQKNIAFASIVEIIEPSPVRVKPPCRYFGVCGGCDFQQMNYEAQLAAKVEIIKDCLQRIGKIEYAGEIKINSAAAWNYRTRAQWKIDAQRNKIGYFKRNSHEICDVETCPILTEKLQETLGAIRRNSKDEVQDSNSAITEIEAVSANAEVSLAASSAFKDQSSEIISLKVGGFEYFYDAKCFFQVNHLLLESFVKAVLQDFRGAAALDLYCGVGLFSLPLSKKFAKVYGIESGWKAIDLARKNALENDVSNVEFLSEDVSNRLAEKALNLPEIDFVVLDPPRDGAEKSTIESLLRFAPPKICYVSCDPATLARDLRMLQTKYRIESIEAYDFFPQTHHIETIVQLSR